ncbi:MAG: ATP-binding protein [Bacteriovoracaceae bacterium]|nr:ATP-binding protein [Bacteriovoracaceae bacterium]
MFKRIIDVNSILKRKGLFLFGPRQTGKSTWVRQTYPNALYINLLSKKVFDDYLLRTDALQSDIKLFQRNNSSNLVIIDEIQKIPELLDEVHNQIEQNKNLRFILTGSSARKLKRAGVNLLGGRASWCSMFPLVYPELKEYFCTITDLEKRLTIGGIPSFYLSVDPFSDFDDYIQLYLSEEIKAEGFVRNYQAFHRFLFVTALCNSKQLNFTQIGSDTQIPPRTVADYFQVLEDTLIGHILPAFTQTSKRKAMTSAKFYLFDTGLVNALLERSAVRAGTTEFGELFEQFVILEVKAYLSYLRKKAQMFYWRSTSKLEVDLIIQSKSHIYAIEIKGKATVSTKDCRGLHAFCEDFPNAKKYVVTTQSRRIVTKDNVEIISIFDFLDDLWSGKIL